MILLQPRWIYDIGFKNKGWFDWDTAVSAFNKYPVGQYAFLLAPNKPDDTSCPWDHESTVYIGMAGGNCCEFRFDDKSGKRNGRGGQIKTSLLDRLLAHGTSMNKITEEMVRKLDPNYQDYYYARQKNPHYKLWIHLFAPNANESSELTSKMRPDVSLIEAESIFLYKARWGNAPMMNRAHRWDLTTRKPDSLSAKIIGAIEKSRLF
jgi:hypothetical protein